MSIKEKANYIILLFFVLFSLVACEKEKTTPITSETCGVSTDIENISNREFLMGFSSWAYGPTETDKQETYDFIANNADIISEQIDNKIPWQAWINDTNLPDDFVNDINYRVNHKPAGHKLFLSATLLNTNRTDLLEDFDGSIPSYTNLSDTHIEEAYFKHCTYLIDAFVPDYFVLSLEVNELLMNVPEKWEAYKALMQNIRTRIKSNYPNLPISESVTLHNWYNPEVVNKNEYISEVTNYVNNFDFVAVSNYPFFKDQHNSMQFQESFDFLHTQTSKPIALTETAHIAQLLDIPSYDISIYSDSCEQKEYLETILLNASSNNYYFVIWWCYRDYDKLWLTFPDEYKEIGKLWLNTGLLKGDGTARPSYEVWKKVFNK